ncbi:bleomycin resistance protein [Pseudomonas sp. TMB3-21]
MTDTKPRLSKAIPILASTDIARTLDFYRGLGFKAQHFEDFSYGMAAWGDVELLFWSCADKYIAENTSCYIRVDDIDAVHAVLKGALPELQDVSRTAWGTAEIYVIDPDGNLLKFGQSLD